MKLDIHLPDLTVRGRWTVFLNMKLRIEAKLVLILFKSVYNKAIKLLCCVYPNHLAGRTPISTEYIIAHLPRCGRLDGWLAYPAIFLA